MTILLERVSKRDEHVAEAKQVAQDIVTNWDNPEYRQAFIWGLGELYGSILEHHYDDLKAILNQAVRMHVGQSRRAIMKSYVRSAVKEEIAKDSLTAAQQYRQRQRQHGRYISYDSPYGHTLTMGMDGPTDESARNAELAAHLHNAYARNVAGAGKQQIMFHIIDPQGNVRVTEPRTALPELGEGEHLIGGTGAGYANPQTVGESMFNVGAALGLHPDTAGAAAGVGQNFQNLVKEHDWGDKLTYMGRALDHANNDPDGRSRSTSVKVAAEMAKLVGKHGPDTTRVLQPHMRRAMFRYRGIEAEPSQYTPAEKRKEGESVDDFSRRLATNLFRKLPTTLETQLMIESGQMPPSRGYLLDRNGNVASVAVGHHDDHYLPFNLRKLGALNGGSYVRSRAYGGPTTDDLHVGMAAGARKTTIVSRSGVYEIQYADRVFRDKKHSRSRIGYREMSGTYRQHGFGDPARVMTRRYARLLDAISKGNVTDPDAKTEIVHPNEIPLEDLDRNYVEKDPNGNLRIRPGYQDRANNQRQRLANERTNQSKRLKLDGHGYDVALRSLYQQYPYFFAKPPKYLSSERASLGGKAGQARSDLQDLGYIRPYHLKPFGVKADWHDERLRPEGTKAPRTFDDVTGYTWGIASRFNKPDGGGTSGTPTAPTPGGGGPRGGAGRTVITPEAEYQAQESRTAGPGQARFIAGRGEVAAGEGKTSWTASEVARNSQVRARINNWLEEYLPAMKPAQMSDQDLAMYQDLVDLRDYPANVQRSKNHADPRVREQAAAKAERTKTLLEELRESPPTVEEYDNFVKAVTGKYGLPFPHISAAPHGETKEGMQRSADDEAKQRRNLQTGVPLSQWSSSREGRRHTEALKNANWLHLTLKQKSGQELSKAEQQGLASLGHWNSTPGKNNAAREFYTTEDGAVLTPNAFWNTPMIGDDGTESTEYHRYTNDEDEDGQTEFERIHPQFVRAYALQHDSEPPPVAVRHSHVFDTHLEDLGERHPKAPARAEDTALEADAKFSQAEEDIANGDLASREVNLDELRDQADRGNTEAAEAYAAQARPDPEAKRIWDENDIENFLSDIDDRYLN